ncbi:MAG TPA: hypothetical protein VFJ58_29800 [Armatimonadota bacterium]|nr:hypothetical protein [Armatimonadota bacterium]
MATQFQRSPASLQQVLELARELSPIEKLRLIETLAPDLETALQRSTEKVAPRRSLRGMFRGCSISSEEIDELRQEMWGSFPPDDL